MALIADGRLFEATTYMFINKADGERALNVWCSSSYPADNQSNVCLWETNENDTAQHWVIDRIGTTNYVLKSVENPHRYLDLYTGSGTGANSNAHLYEYEEGSDTCFLNFEVGSYSDTVRIKLAGNTNNGYYLTANPGDNGKRTEKSSTDVGNVFFKSTRVYDDSQEWIVHRVGTTSGGGNTNSNFDRNYLTYPCSHMKITQTPEDGNHIYCSTESPYDYPIDDRCENAAGRSWMYCPCDEMEIVRIYGVNNSSKTNTIWLESTSPVVMPCGTSKVTMMVIHPEDDDLAGLSVGDTFVRGEAMFREGRDGNADGNHFHFAIGKGDSQGWIGKSHKQWSLSTSGGCIRPEDAFYIDNTFTYIEDAKGISFQTLPQ